MAEVEHEVGETVVRLVRDQCSEGLIAAGRSGIGG